MTQLLEKPTFTARDVCRATGATYRQINHWCSVGYVTGEPWNTGSGSHRSFTEEHVQRIREIRNAVATAQQVLEDAGLNSRAAAAVWGSR